MVAVDRGEGERAAAAAIGDRAVVRIEVTVELYYLNQALMRFGDAKAFVTDLVKALAEEQRQAA